MINSSVSCGYGSEGLPGMEIKFERNCADCGAVTDHVSIDWEAIGGTSWSAEPIVKPPPICEKCAAWMTRETVIAPFKPYAFSELPKSLQKRLQDRELGSQDLDQAVVSRVVGEEGIFKVRMHSMIGKTLGYLVGLEIFTLLLWLVFKPLYLMAVTYFVFSLIILVILVAIPVREFLTRICGITRPQSLSISRSAPPQAAPSLPEARPAPETIENQTASSLLEIQDAVYVTPHYLIVVRDNRVAYIPNSSVKEIGINDINEYSDRGIEVEFHRGTIKYRSGTIQFLAGEDSLIALNRLPEIIRKSKQKGTYWEQDDLRLSV